MLCPKCGQQVHDSAAMCEYCGHTFAQQTYAAQTMETGSYNPGTVQAPAAPQIPQKRENVVAGIVGALVGAAIGGASIILLSQMNLVASISGVLLAICTLKGYELLGGKLSVPGLIICLVLMLVTPYVADRINWAIVTAGELGLSFSEAFQAIPELLDKGYTVGMYEYTLDSGIYTKNLVMLYVFVVLGGVSTVVSAFKNKR